MENTGISAKGVEGGDILVPGCRGALARLPARAVHFLQTNLQWEAGHGLTWRVHLWASLFQRIHELAMAVHRTIVR